MYTIAREIIKENPSWYSLTDKEKEIVDSIAIQIPIRCEEVARIFINYGGDMQKIKEYFLMRYGWKLDI